MIRVVLDTSTFIRGTLEGEEAARRVLQYILLHGQSLMSGEMARELNVAVHQAAARKGKQAAPALRLAALLLLQAQDVRPGAPFRFCADPDDRMFVECAIHGGADVVISNDKSLTQLKAYVTDRQALAAVESIHFMTPGQFLRRFFHA